MGCRRCIAGAVAHQHIASFCRRGIGAMRGRGWLPCRWHIDMPTCISQSRELACGMQAPGFSTKRGAHTGAAEGNAHRGNGSSPCLVGKTHWGWGGSCGSCGSCGQGGWLGVHKEPSRTHCGEERGRSQAEARGGARDARLTLSHSSPYTGICSAWRHAASH